MIRAALKWDRENLARQDTLDVSDLNVDLDTDETTDEEKVSEDRLCTDIYVIQHRGL